MDNRDSRLYGGAHILGPPAQVSRGELIKFYSLISKQEVAFKAFLTDYSDNWQSEWNAEEVYGRMDPIQIYKGTKRKISFSWDIPAEGFEEAESNMDKMSFLINMLYPSFEDVDGNEIINGSPLMRIRFMNLIFNSDPRFGGDPTADGTAKDTGLLGVVEGFSFKPNIDVGFFHNQRKTSVYPKLLTVQCNFSVIHTHKLGFAQDSEKNNWRRYPEHYPHEEIHKIAPDIANYITDSIVSGANLIGKGVASAQQNIYEVFNDLEGGTLINQLVNRGEYYSTSVERNLVRLYYSAPDDYTSEAASIERSLVRLFGGE